MGNGIIGRNALALAAVAAAATTMTLSWPGVLATDTQAQPGEAMRGPVTDWHPPITMWPWVLIGRVSVRVVLAGGPTLAWDMGVSAELGRDG